MEEIPEDRQYIEDEFAVRELESARDEFLRTVIEQGSVEPEWPDSPRYEVVEYSPAGQAKRFAIAKSEDGAELTVEAFLSSATKPDRVTFTLSELDCSGMCDALMNIRGNVASQLSASDAPMLEYLVRVEQQLRANAEYLARLPLTASTAAEISATRSALASRPSAE